nr:protein indeterminate-domain 2-like [Ipomoea batatas]
MRTDADKNDSPGSGEASVSSSEHQAAPPPSKKKRNLPGMPDPDAEVIALSPKTLLATNRFVCEICNKGFQRDQNLQLHRRGHNLPWKLRQRSSKEVKKRVYVCPEPTCVHHDPSRALGDLTGIKKHFCRKHGEKKWKCEKCSKKYAVQSDLKAHSKICGTKEYRCDCGTLFSRRDSFITHRAFCDVLAEESAKAQEEVVVAPSCEEEPKAASPPPPPQSPPAQQPSPPPPPPPPVVPPATTIIFSVPTVKTPELPGNTNANPNPSGSMPKQVVEETTVITSLTGSCSSSSSSSSKVSGSVFASLFASSTAPGSLQPQTSGFTDLFRPMATERVPEIGPPLSTEPISLCLAMSHGSSIFGQERRQYAPAPQPAMSATALLQKAAQMGAASSNSSLLRGLDIMSSTTSSSNPDHEFRGRQLIDTDGASLAAGLGLGLPCDGGSGLKELMLGTPSVFGPKYPTLDLLGLGMAVNGTPTSGLSALMTSIGGNLDIAGSFGSSDFTAKDTGRSS